MKNQRRVMPLVFRISLAALCLHVLYTCCHYHDKHVCLEALLALYAVVWIEFVLPFLLDSIRLRAEAKRREAKKQIGDALIESLMVEVDGHPERMRHLLSLLTQIEEEPTSEDKMRVLRLCRVLRKT